ncbi:hypothetical protein ABIA41_005537 [Bradyrhizobium sp. USDA 313]
MPPPTPLLGGNADAVDPLARIVVHARRRHHRERARDRVSAENLLARDRIDAAIGERRRHHRDVARGDQHGALPEIDVEDAGDIVRDHRIGLEQIADGAVTVAGLAFGSIDGLVVREVASGKAAERAADLLESVRALAVVDQAGAGDRAGIDHRVERMVLGIEPDRVEGIAGGLHADRALDAAGTEQVQRQCEHEWLGHRLDCERHPAVADFIDMAVQGRQADAKISRIGFAQFWNVVGDLA